MSTLTREFVFLILQFLDEEKFEESVHKLEQESGYFFNLKYFEEKVLLGEWEEVEKYLSGFTKVDDNPYSQKIFFEIRKQKYLEALDRRDREKAVDILAKDLKVFAAFNEELYKEITQLLTLEDFRENEQLSEYGDTKSARGIMLGGLRKLIKANPLFKEKLVLPTFKASRLRTLLNQSLNWQHHLCENPWPNQHIITLLTDHACSPKYRACASTSAPVDENGVDAMSRTIEKSKQLKLMEIVDLTQCRQVTMTDGKDFVSKVARLLYTNSGVGILALGTNGVQRLWKWSCSEQNPTGKATANVIPQHWQPNSGLLMKNDVPENPEGTVPCIALSKNDSYVISASGGKVSLFAMVTFKVLATFMPPPPASTFLAFHPQDNNIIAIGMEDSTIHIYNVRRDEVKTRLKGHKKHITGLVFSAALNIMVSSGADARLFFWSADSWEKKKSSAIQLPAGKSQTGNMRVQFHNNQVHLLVSHETQITIYDCTKMECVQKWVPQESLPSAITSTSYSCNSQLVYASFADGNIGVFDAEYLRLRCRIAPSAYIPQPTPYSAPIIPMVITAHPQEPNQIAVGLSDGSVKVLETLEAIRGVADKTGAENGEIQM